MKNRIFDENFKKIHFIGIGGVSMSALAIYLKRKGFTVSGSDNCGKIDTKLSKEGIKVYIGHDRKNAKKKDVFIYSSAIKEGNPEYDFAIENKKPLFKRAELLSKIEKLYKTSVCVCGCHGKTTVTSMIAHILKCANIPFTAFIGGESLEFSNFTLSEKRESKSVFLAEACEYQKNFLYLNPDIAVITNIGFDHPDTYKNLDEVKAAFKIFSSRALKIVNGEDKNSEFLKTGKYLTFGFGGNFVAAKIVKTKGNLTKFFVNDNTGGSYNCEINLTGKYNVLNALSSVCAAKALGIDVEKSCEYLKTYSGVKRRYEFLYQKKGTYFYADYAHHPEEIKSVIKGKRQALFVFQPHTFSRTKSLFLDFSNVFKEKSVILLPTYSARENYDVDGSAYKLYLKMREKNGSVYYAENEKKLFSILDEKAFGFNKVIFLGAGDIYETAKKYGQID